MNRLSSPIQHQRGLTLLELMIALSIAAIIGLSVFLQQVREARAVQARASATHITMIGEAVDRYIKNNSLALSANASTTITTATLKGANTCGAGQQCLDNGVLETNPWGSAYTIRINRVGATAPFSFDALIITTSPWTIGADTVLSLVGQAAAAVRSQWGTAGMTYDATEISGVGGSWTRAVAQFPGITAAGQLGFFISAVNANLDNTYLRIDGTNQMNAPLNMGTNTINNAVNVNASGTVTAGGVASGTITTTGNAAFGADVSVASNLTALNATTNGTLTANGAATFQQDVTIAAGRTLTSAGALNINAAGGLNLNPTSTSATTIGGAGGVGRLQVSGTEGRVVAQGDVEISSLNGMRPGLTNTSVRNLLPTLVETNTYFVGHGQVGSYDIATSTMTITGTTIPQPSCPSSSGTPGTPEIFVIPQFMSGGTGPGAGEFRFNYRATGPVGGAWGIEITHNSGVAQTCTTGVNGTCPGLARVYCRYGT